MSKIDIDLRACACQCVKFSLYTRLCMNICKCMVSRNKTLSDGVMLHWNASTNFRLVDEPTQHDEDGANTITCTCASIVYVMEEKKAACILPKWYHCWKQLLQSPPCCKRSENQRGQKTIFVFAVLYWGNPQFSWTKSNFSKTSTLGSIVRLNIRCSMWLGNDIWRKVELLQQTRQ